MGGELYVGIKKNGVITHYLTHTNWLPTAFLDLDNLNMGSSKILKKAAKSQYGVLCVDYDTKRVFDDNGYFRPGSCTLFAKDGEIWDFGDRAYGLKQAYLRGHVQGEPNALRMLDLCDPIDVDTSTGWVECLPVPLKSPLPDDLCNYRGHYQVQPPGWTYEHRNRQKTSGPAAMRIMGWAT